MQHSGNIPFFEKFDLKLPIREYDFDHGSPGLLGAEISGRPVLIKYWLNRDKDKTEVLQDIWLYEVRQLHRLKGCPGVGDFISPIHESSNDEHGFYLVLDSGARLPLTTQESASKTLTLNRPWITNLKVVKNRIRFWRNIKRIAKALQILHTQGLLHRHLSPDSILTDLASLESDFQLTGFEWSIRVQRMTEITNISPQSSVLKEGRCFSFLSDWADFGKLIATILQFNEDALLDLSYPIETLIADSGLTLNEINLVRGLVGCVQLDVNIPYEGISADLVLPKIDLLISSLKSFEDRLPESLAISFLFNSSANGKQLSSGKTSVFNAVQTVFSDMHGVALTETDISEFINFVREDLSSAVHVAVLPGEDDEDEVILLGSRLNYILNKNKSRREDSEGSWDFAFCHSAYLVSPQKINANTRLAKVNQKITCFSHNDRDGMARFQPVPWEALIRQVASLNDKPGGDAGIALGFAAYHLAEIAYAKSEIYPVELISYLADQDDPSINIVRLKPRSDADSESISEILSIRTPAVRLKKLLTGSQSDYSTWSLAGSSNLNDEEHEVVLDFLRVNAEGGDEIYEFTTISPDPKHQDLYILPSSTQGTIRQLGRRAAAIDALSEHSELSDLLEKPHLKHMESHENSILHPAFHELDESKQEVFKNILKTLPLYLVQGPPGVGKTFLVTALVQQAFSSEPNSRLLLTAQSHSTVLHLYKEVKKALDLNGHEQTPPLIVSCIKDSSAEGETDPMAHLDSLAREYLIALGKSELFNTSPSDASKQKILELSHIGSRSARGSLMNQLLKAANLVFATTNSRQVESLIKSRSQFDWTIMEETGKVTGIELLSPLLLSYRRLMIGDHKQLPPYASEVMRQTLSELPRLKGALEVSLDVYNSSIKGEFIKAAFTQEFLESLTDETLGKISHEALRLHLLFENLVNEEEFARQKSFDYFGRLDRHKPIASMLSIQHRMHPDIASLISDVFYKNALKTSSEKTDFYRSSKPPFYFDVSETDYTRWNSSALLWIDIPDIQANRGFNSGEERPQWHSSLERRVVVNMLSKLKRSDSAEKKPKLALLSPYAKQVEKINLAVERESANLSNLNLFEKPDDSMTFCSTVDAFQGAEADIVIISLVRNNSESYSMGALGFLLDSRRMNVLLSRAKHKLVVVGSYEFLKHWSEKIDREEVRRGNSNHKFLVDLVEKIDKLKDKKLMRFIPYEEILLKNKKSTSAHRSKNRAKR
ncbi:AAA domain-containing protein [Pseudomonas coleopterorum]|uniref:AAA domain-containing protein n=1 Tax=Pseudomonas coleopterorum TaxID=1605838 RepID=A0AAJ6LY40_9PSED|nr:AAA domain-containing protein [Pseudomonas coleopterorum]WNC08810.1 AAA domain-containing protein [Pseudomonas coleopterorum]